MPAGRGCLTAPDVALRPLMATERRSSSGTIGKGRNSSFIKPSHTACWWAANLRCCVSGLCAAVVSCIGEVIG